MTGTDITNGYVEFKDVPVTQGQKETLEVEIKTGVDVLDNCRRIFMSMEHLVIL